MKTKEIDVWVGYKKAVSIDSINSGNSTVYFYNPEKTSGEWSADFEGDDLITKAKLIIELPEKKIKIAEDDAKNVLCNFLNNHGDINIAMKELGFTDD